MISHDKVDFVQKAMPMFIRFHPHSVYGLLRKLNWDYNGVVLFFSDKLQMCIIVATLKGAIW